MIILTIMFAATCANIQVYSCPAANVLFFSCVQDESYKQGEYYRQHCVAEIPNQPTLFKVKNETAI